MIFSRNQRILLHKVLINEVTILKSDIVETILENCQNLGSNEDISTAILATIFEYCPEFTKSFFKRFNDGESCVLFDEYDEFYYNCGLFITQKNFKWAGKNVSFKPDIIISRPEEWTHKLPKNEKIISIESKLWTSLSNNQKVGYKFLKDNLNSWNFYISIEKTDVNEYFQESITWADLINKAEGIVEDEIEALGKEIDLANTLVQMLKRRFIPEEDDLQDERSKFCAKYILRSLFKRSFNKKKTAVNFFEEDEDSYDQFIKFRKKEKIDEVSSQAYAHLYENAKENKWISCVVHGDSFSLFSEVESSSDDLTGKSLFTKLITVDLKTLDDGKDWFECISLLSKEAINS